MGACEKETARQADVMERQRSNPGGAKENFFCCFWISSPRVSLCFAARAALKCLTIHFSVVIERSLLPTAQHFFHPARKHSSAMQLRQTVLCLSAALVPGPRGRSWMWGAGQREGGHLCKKHPVQIRSATNLGKFRGKIRNGIRC